MDRRLLCNEFYSVTTGNVLSELFLSTADQR